jgi:hypothetical protein
MTALRWGVIAAGIYALTGLTFFVFKALSRKRPPFFAVPQGRASRGMAYALGRGLLPWEKESARIHLPSYLGGVAYHLGIFAGFGILGALALKTHLPRLVWSAFRLVAGAGLAAGLGLLAKRALKKSARAISCPDDFGANIFVDIFLAGALAASFRPAVVPFFFGYSIFLLLYIPLGKIRHCVFFFLSRISFGRFFGRRGALPPLKPEGGR